ncbi:MAG: hypothetical protein QG612_1481 [Pseudomonadota bacterium]|nr:hypothetical protein [Pseudomonadota bacterium]
MTGLRSKTRSKMLIGSVLLALSMSSPVVRAAPEDAVGDPIMRFIGQQTQKATETASDLIMSAMNFLGVRYRFGGNAEETGFDCSGFTRHVFENSVGLLLPRRASDQAEAAGLLTIRKEDLKPGDLVFFNTMRRAFSHVGIYVGDGKFIHAPRTGSSIRVDDMNQSYWTMHFDGARRAPQVNPDNAPVLR